MSRTIASVCLLLAMGVGIAACEKEKPQGACEVDYSGLGEGQACTVVREDQCVDTVSPPINILTTTKKKAFTAGKTCQDAGYTKAGCADVPIAWAFKGNCPQ